MGGVVNDRLETELEVYEEVVVEVEKWSEICVGGVGEVEMDVDE